MPGVSFSITSLINKVPQNRDFDFDQGGVNLVRTESDLGVPYKAQNSLGYWYFLPATLGGVALQNCIVRIQGKKTIVETPLVARRGSVKELISIDDYRISIRGYLIGADDNYPEAAITELRDLFERNEALKLQNALTQIFLQNTGKDTVVITSLDFPEYQGAENIVAYAMELVSDLELNLIVE